MKKGERQKPDIFYDRLARLKPEEKEELRTVLKSPLYLKLMRIVEGNKPSANCALAGSHVRDAFSGERANARLGEIRGWELHIAAIFAVLHDAPPRSPEPEPSYPDSGMPKLEPQILDKK
jgi:hypothetical protein